MVMRVGQRRGGERGCVHICGRTQHRNRKTHRSERKHPPHTHTQVGMAMHANIGMYINAQMPTLDAEIAKLQPVSS